MKALFVAIILLATAANTNAIPDWCPNYDLVVGTWFGSSGGGGCDAALAAKTLEGSCTQTEDSFSGIPGCTLSSTAGQECCVVSDTIAKASAPHRIINIGSGCINPCTVVPAPVAVPTPAPVANPTPTFPTPTGALRPTVTTMPPNGQGLPSCSSLGVFSFGGCKSQCAMLGKGSVVTFSSGASCACEFTTVCLGLSNDQGGNPTDDNSGGVGYSLLLAAFSGAVGLVFAI